MATMVVRALRRGRASGRGSRSLAQSLRRFVSTLVVAEHEGGFVKPSSLSALAAAEAIAKENKISLLLGGSGPALHKAAEHAASSHPLVSEVLVADSDAFAHPLAEPWAELLRSVQQKRGFSHVIASSTSFGKNLLPRAAALLDVSPVTDVTAIFEPRVFVRPIYAGNALCTVRYTGEDPCMMSIRSTSFCPTIEAMSETKVAPVTQVDLSFLSEGSLGKSTWVNLTTQDTERPDLANARVVLTGGRGLKSAENFKLLEQLAEKLGAAVGATRAAVDAGFVPNELQSPGWVRVLAAAAANQIFATLPPGGASPLLGTAISRLPQTCAATVSVICDHPIAWALACPPPTCSCPCACARARASAPTCAPPGRRQAPDTGGGIFPVIGSGLLAVGSARSGLPVVRSFWIRSPQCCPSFSVLPCRQIQALRPASHRLHRRPEVAAVSQLLHRARGGEGIGISMEEEEDKGDKLCM